MQGTQHAKPSQVSNVSAEIGSCVSSVNDWCTMHIKTTPVEYYDSSEVMWYGSKTNLDKLPQGYKLIESALIL